MNESVPVSVADGLKRRGAEAITARDTGNLGLSDEAQLAYAVAHQMVLFTHDTDFLLLAHQHTISHGEHWGIIYVHQDKLSIGEWIRRLKEIADLFRADGFRNHVELL